MDIVECLRCGEEVERKFVINKDIVECPKCYSDLVEYARIMDISNKLKGEKKMVTIEMINDKELLNEYGLKEFSGMRLDVEKLSKPSFLKDDYWYKTDDGMRLHIPKETVVKELKMNKSNFKCENCNTILNDDDSENYYYCKDCNKTYWNLKSIKIINLTLNDITLYNRNNEIIAQFKSSGIVRCIEKRTVVGTVNGVDVIRKNVGRIEGSPELVKNTLYIVSKSVAEFETTRRKDLLITGDTCLNDDGEIMGYYNFRIL